MTKKDYVVVKAEWCTQQGTRPQIGLVSIYNGYLVKTYIGTCKADLPEEKGIEEIVELGGKYREYTPRQWQAMGEWLPVWKGVEK